MKKFNFNLGDDAVQKKLSPFASVIFGFIVGFIVLFLLGYNPVEGFTYLFQGGFKGILTVVSTGFSSTDCDAFSTISVPAFESL